MTFEMNGPLNKSMITTILTVGRTPITVVGAAADTQLELVRDP